MSTVMHFDRRGSVLAIHDDDFPWAEAFGRTFVHERRRASTIETVEDGPNAGRFYVDFTHLWQLTHRPEFCVCLTQTFDKEAEAKVAEVQWLIANYIAANKRRSAEIKLHG